MNLNLDLNRLGQINEGTLDQEKERKRIVNYLYQLTEQLRYWQYNLEEENFSPELREDYKAIKNGLSELRVEADEISSLVIGDDEDGLVAAWTQIRQNLQNISLAAGRIETMTDGTDYATKLINSALTLSPTELTVAFNDETAMSLTSSSADFYVDTLSVSGHIEGDVMNTQAADSFTVSSANPVMSDLQTWVNGLGKYITGNITINIQAALEGTLYIRGFKSSNSSSVNIIFSSNGRLYGNILVQDCDRVTITGKGNLTNFDIIPLKEQYGLQAGCVKYLQVSNLYIDISESSYSGNRHCFRTDGGTHAYYNGCAAAGGAYGWYLNGCTQALIYNCIGGQGAGEYAFNSGAVLSLYGSYVKVAGSKRPYGTCTVYLNAATIDVYSGAIQTAIADDYEGLPSDAGDSGYSYATLSPAISSANTYGGTLITSGSSPTSTDQTAVVSHTASNDGKVRCGKTSAGYNWGIWYFGTNITGLSNKGTLLSATVTLTRLSHEGGNTSNNFNLYWYSTATPGGSNAATETPGYYFNNSGSAKLVQSNIAVNLGKSKTITLTGDALAALKAGTLAGFGVGGSCYMQFSQQGCVLNCVWSV